MLWNGFGNTADAQTLSVDVGGYNPLLGRSYGEIAADSRTNHKSQGFGSARTRGSQRESLTLIAGEAIGNSLMSGVDTTWKRTGNSIIEKILDSAIAGFNLSDPSASVPQLIRTYRSMDKVEDNNAYWRDKKLTEFKEVIMACAGLYIEAVTTRQYFAENDSLRFTVNAINRSTLPVNLNVFSNEITSSSTPVNLVTNASNSITLKRKLTEKFMYTQPYWLRLGMEQGTFNVTNQQLIGRAENEPVMGNLSVGISDLYITITLPILYKSVDPVKGESYNPVIITPREKIYSNNNLVLFRKGRNDSAEIILTVVPEETTAPKTMSLELQSSKFSFLKPIPDYKPTAGISSNYPVKIGNYLQRNGAERDTLKLQLQEKDSREIFGNTSRTLTYEHIPTINYFYRDAVQVLNIDLKTVGNSIGYIPGAGDKVPDALRQMGYTVTELTETTVTPELLKTFDAVITGVRAYDVNPYMAGKYDILMAYVQNGGNLIVQYNRNNTGQLQNKIGPYPFAIANKRITEEEAPVTFSLTDHPALNTPNKITQKDFTGWIQERSTYQAEQTDSRYEMPLAMHDTGETDSNGSLLIGKYGKGNFVYASLVFFRELPAGVPGAYRLLANLIALGK